MWDPDGRLLWAPPQACDLRFDEDDVELLFTSWRERRAWTSGMRLRRAAASREEKNLRLTLATRSAR